MGRYEVNNAVFHPFPASKTDACIMGDIWGPAANTEGDYMVYPSVEGAYTAAWVLVDSYGSSGFNTEGKTYALHYVGPSYIYGKFVQYVKHTNHS
jgi:hypothetical protein